MQDQKTGARAEASRHPHLSGCGRLDIALERLPAGEFPFDDALAICFFAFVARILLISLHAVFRCQAVFNEKQLPIGLEQPTYLGKGHGHIANSTEPPGGDNRFDACIFERNGLCRSFNEP